MKFFNRRHIFSVLLCVMTSSAVLGADGPAAYPSSSLKIKTTPSAPKKCRPRDRFPAGVHQLDVKEELTEIKHLGEGDFAEVLSAIYQGRQKVFKIMKSHISYNEVVRERTRQERAAATGAAPNPQAAVFGLTDSKFSSFGFSMDFISHSMSLKDFRELIGARPQGEQVALLRRVAELTLQSLNTLHGAISHNDMAPENILVICDSEGFDSVAQVLLIDFGIFDGDQGHPEYHANISLQVSPKNLDLIALSLIFIDERRPSARVGKISIAELLEKISTSAILETVKGELITRLKAIDASVPQEASSGC